MKGQRTRGKYGIETNKSLHYASKSEYLRDLYDIDQEVREYLQRKLYEEEEQ